jgi:hypothetical protein
MPTKTTPDVAAALASLHNAAHWSRLVTAVPAAAPLLADAVARAVEAQAAWDEARVCFEVACIESGVREQHVLDGTALAVYGPTAALPVMQAHVDARTAIDAARSARSTLDAAGVAALDHPEVRAGLAAYLQAQAQVIEDHMAVVSEAQASLDAFRTVINASRSLRERLRYAEVPLSFSGGRTPMPTDWAKRARSQAAVIV